MSKVKYELRISEIENAEIASNLQNKIIELIDKEMKLTQYPVLVSFYHVLWNTEKEK